MFSKLFTKENKYRWVLVWFNIKTCSPKRRPISEVFQSKLEYTEKLTTFAAGESLGLPELRLLFRLQPLENEVCGLVFEDRIRVGSDWSVHGVFHDRDRLLYDKVTVLESEKQAWENSPEAQAIREALNPWRNCDAEASKES